MHYLLIHIATVVWLVHAVFGSCFHHTHPGASLCAAGSDRCEHACPQHKHGGHHHDHDGHHHDGSHEHDSPGDAPADHSCPAHHHSDDGSCGFVASNLVRVAELVAAEACALSEVCELSAGAPSHEVDAAFSAPHRGPPVRPHLLNQVLLI